MSQTTKKHKKLMLIYKILSLASIFSPMLIYMVKAFIEGEPKEKFTLGMTIILSIILTMINTLFKYKIRSTIWILLLGVYFCIDNIIILLFIMAGSTILDEFMFTPLYLHHKNKYLINKEIDARVER